MKLALVSTYPPAQCGIGNYAHQLVRALGERASDVEVTVLDEPAVWDRRGDWVTQIVEGATRVAPDVVHVQHEDGIFGHDDRLARALDALRARGIRSVVTLHSVYATRAAGAFHRRLAADRLIVHQKTGMASVLAEQGVPADRVVVIPHGTPALQLPDRAAARAQLGLPADAPVALFFGFIHTGKRLHVAIDAFEAARVPDARFVIAGRMREDNVFQRIYAGWLRRKLRAGIEAGRILYRPGFASDEDKLAYYAAADVVVMPHVQAYGSASGVMHEAISAGRAFVCTRGKKFAEAVEALSAEMPEAFPAAGDRAGWQSAIAAMLSSPERRARMTAMLGGLAEETSWPASAERHAEVYRALASAQERAA